MAVITDKYAALGGSAGFLGPAVGPESTCPDNVGRFQHYEHGSIYWHPDTGAHEVHGLIHEHWKGLGWERSWLGYPTSDELAQADGKRVSWFANGAIRWDQAEGARDGQGTAFLVHYAQTLSQQEAEFEKLKGQRRLITLSSYAGDGSGKEALRFASVLTSEPGRRQVAAFGVTESQRKNWIDQQRIAGFHPVLVAVTLTSAGGRLYSVVCEAYADDEAKPRAFFDLTVDGSENTVGSLAHRIAWARDNWFIPSSVDLYENKAGASRVSLALVPNPGRVSWNTRLLDTVAETDAWARIYGAHGMTPFLTSRTVGGRLIALWRADTLGAGWLAKPPAPEATFRSTTKEQIKQGRIPISIAAGSGAFTGIWSHRATPLRKHWTVTGRAVPALAAFDEAMRAYLESAGIRCASLAIAKDRRLVYARAFTNAPSNHPIATPTSTSRIGSAVKVVTALRILKWLDEPGNPWTEDDSVADVLNLGKESPPEFDTVTIKELLRHESGVDGPNFNHIRTELSKLAGKPYASTTKRDCVRYLATLPVGPKSFMYSNNGFVALGAVIEEVTNRDYDDDIRATLFQPLGSTRAHRAGTDYQDRPANELRYETEMLGIGAKVRSADTHDRTLVGYGDENDVHGDACGAMSFAMPDLVALLSCLAHPSSKVLSAGVRDKILPATNTDYRCWRARTVDGQRVFGHGGGNSNAHAYVSYRVGDNVALAVSYAREGTHGFCHATPDWDQLVADVGSGDWSASGDEFAAYGLEVV